MDDFALTPLPPKDERFSIFKQRIFDFYRWRWHRDATWGPAEANQLARVLRENPTLDVTTFCIWLRNYGFSQDISPGERPCKFLPHIYDYSVTSLDRFRRSQNVSEKGNSKHGFAERATREIELAERISTRQSSQNAY